MSETREQIFARLSATLQNDDKLLVKDAFDLVNTCAETYSSSAGSALEIWVSSTSGADTNDGYSAAAPKLTLQAAFDLIPDTVDSNVVVHMSGTFSEFSSAILKKHILYGRTLLLDGGADYTVVDDNGGAHYTATAATTTLLTVGGAGWTPDEHAGYIVNVLSGDAAGEDRMCQVNDGTTITPIKDFATDPAGVATFDLVRPATLLASSTANSTLYLGCTGAGFLRLQRFSMSGTKMAINMYRNRCGVIASHIVNLSSKTYNIFCSMAASIKFNGNILSPTTFLETTTTYAGVSQLAGSVDFRSIESLELYGSYLTDVTMIRSGIIGALRYGSRVKGTMTVQSCSTIGDTVNFDADAGYATPSIDNSTGVGLTVYGKSTLYMGAIDIHSNTTHGMEVIDSKIHFTGITTSTTANTTAGVYAHTGSNLVITNGSAPTLTGTAAGDVSVDGTTNATTWAAVDSGSPLADTTEFVLVKEI